MANTAVLRFDTGPLQGLVKSRLFRNKMVSISPKPGKNTISFERSQKELNNMMKMSQATHQHITKEAIELIMNTQPDPELELHKWQIISGAQLEDYAFLPGENLNNLILEKPEKLPATVMAVRSRVKRESLGAIPRVVEWAAALLRDLGLSPLSDPLNKPYMSHFLNPRKPDGMQGLSLLDGKLRFRSSKERAQMYWNLATSLYLHALETHNDEELARAFIYLGHACHLIQDTCVPAHVHNDPHGPGRILGKLDSFETWLIKNVVGLIATARFWNRNNAVFPEMKPGWQLGSFMNTIAMITHRYRSVDGKGAKLDREEVKYHFAKFKSEYKPWYDKYLNQSKTGALSDEECYFQGCVQIPAAISHTAELILRFKETALIMQRSKLLYVLSLIKPTV